MKNYLLPRFLSQGDKAIIISPSGNIDNRYITAAKDILSNWGLVVETAPYAGREVGRFCGTPAQRLSDLQYAMDDPENRLIFCSRGGYGIIHLLDKLNFEAIKRSPKWLVGYSDITALHSAFLKNGILSLHAPMARHLSEYGEDNPVLCMKQTLFGSLPDYSFSGHSLNVEGRVKGRLFGGNLAVMYSLLCTPYFKVPNRGVLFIEDIGEQPYRIDRMIWSLKLSGLLNRIKGLIIGSFTDYDEDPLMYLPVYESINKIVEDLHIPVVYGFPVGHTRENYPLIHGGKINLNVKDTGVSLKYIK